MAKIKVRETVDRAAELHEKVKHHEKILKGIKAEYKEVVDSLVEHFEIKHSEEDAGILQGSEFIAEIGARAIKTHIKNAELYDALEGIEQGLFYDLVKFDLYKIKAHLPKEEFEEVVVTEYSGPRRVKFVHKQ